MNKRKGQGGVKHVVPKKQLKRQHNKPEALKDGLQNSERGIQQDDNYKEFMGWITDGGLRYAYAMHHGTSENLYRKKVDKEMKRHVIIVGAGMAGLAAAYELAQAGHEVTILEAQYCVGGRVKTVREGFAEGLLCEGGAMRLPPDHYLTWHYLNLFDIETVPFQNYNGKGYLYLYGEKIRLDDWEKNNKKYCDKFWSGWDKNLTDEDKEKYKIDGILTYYTATMRPVMDELGTCPTEKTWQDWLCKWSKISGDDFLRGCGIDKKSYPLTAWPEPAIEGLMESTFMPSLKRNLAAHLRDDLGTLESMRTPKFGMDTLPKAFAKKNKKGWNTDVDLSKNIKFGIMVTAVENFETVKKRKKVKVTGINRTTGQMEVTEADAVILTLPLHILRQLDIPFSKEQRNAFSHIHCVAYTKVMLQCKTRFWQKDVGQGGFSKIDTTTGQLRYPDYEGSGIDDDERGILSLFTSAESALTHGSQSEEMAILSAVRDISKIHPEIKSEFEVGAVQAWHSDPIAQGAFAFLKPHEFINHMNLLTKHTETIYLAGDALSWAHTWIQGAIFSGLMQAYCFQSHLEDKCICEPVSLMLD